MDRREQDLSIYKHHSCGIIILEDREKRIRNLTFSVFHFLVAISKTQKFNPWLYSLSYFALGAAIDL